MFGFFKDKRDIDQVIFDIAEHQRPRDHERLFQLLQERELFTPIASSNVPFEDGASITVKPGDVINLKTAKLPNGMVCIVFYVHRSDSRLGEPFAGFAVRDALDMVIKTTADAMLIQNVRDSWVAFPRGELPAIRAKHF